MYLQLTQTLPSTTLISVTAYWRLQLLLFSVLPNWIKLYWVWTCDGIYYWFWVHISCFRRSPYWLICSVAWNWIRLPSVWSCNGISSWCLSCYNFQYTLKKNNMPRAGHLGRLKSSHVLNLISSIKLKNKTFIFFQLREREGLPPHCLWPWRGVRALTFCTVLF